MPAGYPIADNLTTNSAQQALSAKQGVKINEQLNSLRILCVGNSFSADSMSYVPIILANLGIEVEMGILFYPACSLQQHWENRASTTFYTYFHHYTPSAGKWVTENSKGLAYGLAAADWDVVVLQQNSQNCMDYSTYQPYLNNLIDYIVGIKPNIKVWWNMTHAWATGASYLTEAGVTSDEMAAIIKANAQKVYAETAVQMVLPYGEAVQLARHDSTLSTISGLYGLCQSDYVHLHDGIGCQVASYTNAEAILRFMRSNQSVMGDTLNVDNTFLTTYAIPENSGSAIGSTAANRLLAQRYAIIANNAPY